jgi:hypothetical protein
VPTLLQRHGIFTEAIAGRVPIIYDPSTGIPDTNLNQLAASQLALGSSLLERVPNPYYGIIPSSSSLGDPTIPRAQLLKPYPTYTTVSLYRNNVGTTAIKVSR